MWALILIWIGVLLILHKTGLKFFKFILGSLGVFCFSILLFNRIMEAKILEYLSFALKYISELLDFFTVYPAYGMINIERGAEAYTFFLDYECTGILEILVYLSLVAFYPIHTGISKLYYAVTGVIYILAVNVLRVMIIVFIVHRLGIDYFFLAHTILARLVFFTFVVNLYYRTFTKPHVRLQEVGDAK